MPLPLQTLLVTEPDDVNNRLAEFGVTLQDMTRIAVSALGPLRRAIIREGILPHLALPRLMQQPIETIDAARRRAS